LGDPLGGAGGRIIQISSLGGRIGSPGMTACQSAKWAVGKFSEALAAQVPGASMTTPPPSPPYQDTAH